MAPSKIACEGGASPGPSHASLHITLLLVVVGDDRKARVTTAVVTAAVESAAVRGRGAAALRRLGCATITLGAVRDAARCIVDLAESEAPSSTSEIGDIDIQGVGGGRGAASRTIADLNVYDVVGQTHAREHPRGRAAIPRYCCVGCLSAIAAEGIRLAPGRGDVPSGSAGRKNSSDAALDMFYGEQRSLGRIEWVASRIPGVAHCQG